MSKQQFNEFTPEFFLMTPGPVMAPPSVLRALAQPMLHHRTPAFEKIFLAIQQEMQKVFQTKQTVFFHAATGTGAMESAIVNTLSPGDTVLVIVSGKFGERWAEMAQNYGLHTLVLNIPWGQSVEVKQVKILLETNPGCRAVFCQAVETSTGAVHPIEQLAKLIQGHANTLFIVDGITAVGGYPLAMDDWGIDILLAGSQKAFMLPTGLSMIAASAKAWKRIEEARLPRYYFDLLAEKLAYAKGETRFSSPVSLLCALDAALKHIQQNGLAQHYAGIACLAQVTRSCLVNWGFELFPMHPAPTVSAMLTPPNINSEKLRQHLEEKYKVTLMGGQDQLKGKIIRMGHMGYIRPQDLMYVLSSIGQTLNDLGGALPKEQQQQGLKTSFQTLVKHFGEFNYEI